MKIEIERKCCDKEQGTVEAILSKREIQLKDTVLIAADYERIADSEYKITYFIGYTDWEILEEYKISNIKCAYSNLIDTLIATFKMWASDKQIKADIRNKLREVVTNAKISCYGITMVEYNLINRLYVYGKMRMLVEINTDDEKYIVYVKSICGDLLKIYESALPDNDLELYERLCMSDIACYGDDIGKDIEKNMQKVIEFIEMHKAELIIV